MNQNEQVKSIVSHLSELGALFHGLFGFGQLTPREKRTTSARYYILKCLNEPGPRNLTEICRWVHYKKNTLSELLDRMVGDGLVERIVDSGDRRCTNFSLTRAGLRAIGDFEQKFVRTLDDFLATLPEELRGGFLGCLGSLVQITKSCRQPGPSHSHEKTKSR